MLRMASQNAMLLSRAQMMVPAARSFASFEKIERASQKLVKALESEIKYENENYSRIEDI